MNKFEYITSSVNDPLVILPTKQTLGSAAYDFVAPKSVIISPNTNVRIFTGIKAKMDPGTVLILAIRSSIAVKRDIILVNSIGVIDSDYYNNEDNEGEIIAVLRNIGSTYASIDKGERFMQGMFMTLAPSEGEVNNNIRKGGIGSTDK